MQSVESHIVEPTELTVEPVNPKRQKPPRSEAQLVALEAARSKALKIRQERAELMVRVIL